jgi:hypothetical protein
MKNKYVSFITDDHFLDCIGNLHRSYIRAKNNITKKNFYKNKVDTIKLTFDAKFNDINEEDLIQSEILRQVDKSINNSIGTFHEQILGGVPGFEIGNFSDFDIKASDDSLFATFGSTEITKNISEGVFEILANKARLYVSSKFYYVLIDDDSDTNEKWVIGNEEYSVSQKRVFKISIKQLYKEVTKQENAYQLLCKVLPTVCEDYLSIQQPS